MARKPSGTVGINNIVFNDNHLVVTGSASGTWGGGVIFSKADLTVTGSTFSDNTTSHRYAGAIYANSGILTINDSHFINNSGFLVFYIAGLITGSLFNIDRKLLLRASLKLLPVAVVSILAGVLVCGLLGVFIGNGCYLRSWRSWL